MEQKWRLGGLFSKIWLIAILLIAAGAIIIYMLFFYSQDINNSAATPIGKVQKPKVPTTSKPIGVAPGSMLAIPELGVKLNISSELSGMTYTVTKAPSAKGDLVTVQFIMSNYSSLANKCAGVDDKTAHPFANLSKVPGHPAGVAQESIMKQFQTYFIINSGSSLPPQVTCKDKTTQQQLQVSEAKLTGSLKKAFQDATKA